MRRPLEPAGTTHKAEFCLLDAGRVLKSPFLITLTDSLFSFTLSHTCIVTALSSPLRLHFGPLACRTSIAHLRLVCPALLVHRPAAAHFVARPSPGPAPAAAAPAPHLLAASFACLPSLPVLRVESARQGFQR